MRLPAFYSALLVFLAAPAASAATPLHADSRSAPAPSIDAAPAPSGSDPFLLGDQSIEPTTDSNAAGMAEAFPLSSATAGSVSSISVYVDSQNEALDLVVGLYSDSGDGHPAALLTSGVLTSPVAGAWNQVPVRSAAVASGHTYWVAVLGRGGALYFRDRSVPGCSSESSQQTDLSLLPDAWESGQQWNSCSISAHVDGAVVPAPTNTALPGIIGSTVSGRTLTTSNGSWTADPSSYAYRWQDCDSSGDNCSFLGGATARSYKLTDGDVGHTLRAVVTATNVAGSATATSAQTAAVSASGGGGGLPPGVTLKAIDGGPKYYCSHGFTNACNDGWDDPSFFPIGPWYGNVSDESDVTRWKDLGLNTAFRTNGSYTSLSLMKANGIYAIVEDDNGTPETPGLGSETVGLLSADEPSTLAAGVTNPLSQVPNSQQDGRFWYLNNSWNFIYWGGLSPEGSSSDVLSKLVATPAGTQRHIDIQSVDTYWFGGANETLPYEGRLMYGLGDDMPVGEVKCGCRYGDMVDQLRAFQTTYPAPIFQFVEDGDPYADSSSAYITPDEMNWAMWSSIIHGARGIIYFNHSFYGPAPSNDNFAQSYYQTAAPGQSTSIYAQAKATDALIKQLAPEINAPQALGYVTVSPSTSTFSGIETRATYDNGTFTIFADTRDAETASSFSATFTTADDYTGPVTVVGENRTVQAINGVFTDVFAHASKVHVYQITPPAS